MAQIDQRTPKNILDQSKSDLEAAKVRLTNAEAAFDRGKELHIQKSISDQAYEDIQENYAQAKSTLVRSEVSYENAILSSKKSSRKQNYVGNPCTKHTSAIFVEKNRPRSLAGTHTAPEFAFSQRGCCKTHIGVQQREGPLPEPSAFSHRKC